LAITCGNVSDVISWIEFHVKSCVLLRMRVRLFRYSIPELLILSSDRVGASEVAQGFVDHADSLGNYGRFGNGDVQWMSAARGVSHSEMFPLLNREKENVLELFQVWINLPKRSKMLEPGYVMMWAEDLPRVARDAADEAVPWQELKSSAPAPDKVVVTLIGGSMPGMAAPPPPPPHSWGADPGNDVLVLTLQLPAGAVWTLPAYTGGGALEGLHRNIYFFAGSAAVVDGMKLSSHKRIKVRPEVAVQIEAGSGGPAEILVLQGRDLCEQVVQHGPFVVSSPQEVRQAMLDYSITGFGEWKFPNEAPVQAREAPRFMKYTDGTSEERPI